MTFDGIGIDIQHDFPANQTVLVPRMQAAEHLGYDSVWFIGGLFPGAGSAMELLAYAAGVTSTIGLGVGVVISPVFAPLHLARSAATVDSLSRGRLSLGLGLGHGDDRYARHGVARPAHSGRHFDHNVETVRSLLRNEKTGADDPPLHDEPRPLAPARSGGPPLWIGGAAQRALDRAARLGDGWLAAGAMPIASFAAAADTVRDRLAAHARDAASFRLGKRVTVHVADRSAATRERLGEWFSRGTGDRSRADRVVIYGTADDVVGGLSRLRMADADLLALTPLFDVDEQMERLTTEVCPHLPPATR